jgi:hypothetical protein
MGANDKTIETTKLDKLADELRASAETLRNASDDAMKTRVDGGKHGTLCPFLRGQAAAYENAAALIDGLHKLPF